MSKPKTKKIAIPVELYEALERAAAAPPQSTPEAVLEQVIRQWLRGDAPSPTASAVALGIGAAAGTLLSAIFQPPARRGLGTGVLVAAPCPILIEINSQRYRCRFAEHHQGKCEPIGVRRTAAHVIPRDAPVTARALLGLPPKKDDNE